MHAPKGTVPQRFFHSFIAGEQGAWHIERIHRVSGVAVALAPRLDIAPLRYDDIPSSSYWSLRGATSNERYVTQAEKGALRAKAATLDIPAATRAALIPIRKSPAWWALPQDERRAIVEEKSRHISIGLKYLPAIARRLYHCRDLGDNEPFDFLTWFQFSPSDEWAFDELLVQLRACEEWQYVDREVDIRLTLGSADKPR